MSREVTIQTSELLTRISTLQKSKWADRFIQAAVVQGALAAGLTTYLLYEGVFGSPAASKIVAAGGAGTWLTVGYLAYIPFGPLAAAVTALFYRQIEAYMHKPYTGWTNRLAWLHLALMNVGVVGATWLMMNAGYRGGALAQVLGADKSLTAAQISTQVHQQILVGYPPYIAAFIAVALVGAIAGGLGYVIVSRRPLQLQS